ncbi:PAS domain S-box protein [Desulfobacterales bacterium HSG17]|nr:PAS domain S-box protein [Desulfobacterales bacterium HSG17]
MEMNSPIKRKWGYAQQKGRLLFLAFFALIFFFSCTHKNLSENPWVAQSGLLDLRAYDFATQPPIPLKGQWDFYWQQLVNPNTFLTQTMKQGEYINVPGGWHQTRNLAEPKPIMGFATYHLKIQLPDHCPVLSLKTKFIHSAHALYVGGQELSLAGIVGDTQSSSSPQTKPNIIEYIPPDKILHLTIQVSNFHTERAGLWDQIYLGTPKSIHRMVNRQLMLDLFLLGVMVVMGLYHIGLYVVHRKDRVSLYFGCFTLLLCTYMLYIGQSYVMSQLFPNQPFIITRYTVIISWFAALPFFALYTWEIFPQLFHKKVLIMILCISSASIGLLLMWPFQQLGVLTNIQRVYALLIGFYILITALRAVLHGVTGARTFFSGFVLLFAAVVNDLLYGLMIIRSVELTHFGLFLFIFFQAFLISKRFANSFTTIERLEKSYRSLFENAIEGIYQSTPAGRYKNANPALAEMLGYASPEELIQTVMNIGIEIYAIPEDRQRWKKSLAEQGRVNGFETRFIRKDEIRIWVSISGYAVRDEISDELYYEGRCIDITERKTAIEGLRESEERYRSVMEAAPDPIVLYDMEGRVLYLNPAFESVFGWSLDELRHKKIDFVPADQWPKTQEMVHKVIRGEDIIGFQTRRFTRDNRLIDLIASASVFKDPDGNPQGSVVSFKDITRLKQVEEELRRTQEGLEKRVAERTAELADANRHLKELDRMKSKFLSSVSHELRTPLTSILGFTKLIQNNFQARFYPLSVKDSKLRRKGDKILENIGIIREEGERLTRLINDVLDLSKIESGRVDWRDQIIAPRNLIQQAINVVSGEIKNKPDVELTTRFSEDLPNINVDQDRLLQVLVNLLNNAIKFTAKGFIEIYVIGLESENSRISQHSTAPILQVSVKDSGIGIPAADLDKIFDQFHQVVQKDTLEGKPTGTGLGLPICRDIITHYKGVIWAESEPGTGATIIFQIPAKV